MADTVVNWIGRAPPERRACRRFPIVAALEYRAFRGKELVREGIGRTINIGSRGILFKTEPPLDPDLRLELFVEWPALPATDVPLRLHALAQIVRLGEDGAAVRLFRPEFERRESRQ